ncbi:carbohydrate sulfotransferase 11-like isoform X2 [Ptychodera flava]|uniref:carbohydrate sulfotransferase 11-like isoform X2 n=1 Tax=Ptychodera flava TaxID=63121 RepID=UPI003969E366
MKTVQRWTLVFTCALAIYLLLLSSPSYTPYKNVTVRQAEGMVLNLNLTVEGDTTHFKAVKNQSNARNEQKSRLSLVEQQCRKYRVGSTLETISSRTLDHLIVDDKYRLIYCFIPKVACTNWKKLLVFLNDDEKRYKKVDDVLPHDAHHSATMRKLSDYSFKEIESRLRSYLKFIFVRDPMERLVSAYVNKFTKSYNSSREFQRYYGSQIVQLVRENASAKSLQEGHDVTFEEFVRYIVDHRTQERGPQALNEHWRQYYYLCHPCVVNYDFIGHYDSLMDDADQLLKMANLDKLVSFPKPLPGQGQTKYLVDDFYKNLSSHDAYALWRLYNVDYVMFGYTFPKHFYKKRKRMNP